MARQRYGSRGLETTQVNVGISLPRYFHRKMCRYFMFFDKGNGQPSNLWLFVYAAISRYVAMGVYRKNKTPFRDYWVVSVCPTNNLYSKHSRAIHKSNKNFIVYTIAVEFNIFQT